MLNYLTPIYNKYPEIIKYTNLQRKYYIEIEWPLNFKSNLGLPVRRQRIHIGSLSYWDNQLRLALQPTIGCDSDSPYTIHYYEWEAPKLPPDSLCCNSYKIKHTKLRTELWLVPTYDGSYIYNMDQLYNYKECVDRTETQDIVWEGAATTSLLSYPEIIEITKISYVDTLGDSQEITNYSIKDNTLEWVRPGECEDQEFNLYIDWTHAVNLPTTTPTDIVIEYIKPFCISDLIYNPNQTVITYYDSKLYTYRL